MKKIVIGFLLSMLSLAWANAQSVNNYKFVSSTGTYTALAGGTALTQIPADASNVAPFVYNADTKVELGDENIQQTIAGIDLGFDFKLGGETFSKFAVAGYGYLLLGKADGDIAFTARDFLMNRMDGVTTAIGIATDESVYNLAVSYALTGGEGSHVLTVQFAGIKYAAVDDAGTMNYQIKLYEADNHVEMIFDEYPDDNSWDGMRFNVGLAAGDQKHFRKPDDNWVTTIFNDNTTTSCWSLPGFPSGLTYAFSLPEPCDAPTYTITELKLTPASDEMAIDVFIDTTGSAEGYLVVVSDAPVTEDPAGRNFTKDQQALGGTVLAVGALSEFNPNRTNPDRSKAHLTFTHSNLQPNTAYYYTVYLSNTTSCLASYTQPVSKQMATATTAPAGLQLVSATLSEVKFSATANDLNEEIAILMTTGKGADENGNRIYVGNFAPIPADAEVGDKFTTSYTYRGETTIDTTIVLYKGAAGADIACPVALANNRIYYFGAVSRGKDNGFYSSSAANAEPYLSPAALPFKDNFALNLSRSENNPFIGGWAKTENFEVSSSATAVDGAVSTMGTGPDGAVLVIPALDFPTDSNVLVNINYSLDPYAYNSDKVEGDSIALEISIDGGKTFKTLKAVHKETDNLTLGKVILSDYLGAKQAILRLRVVNANPNKAWNVKVSSINITALPFCPEPGKAYVTATYGGTLGLTWAASENNETQWNISTAPVAADGEEPAWSRPLLVEQKPYFLTGLGNREIYNVRIQAVCVGGRTSGWVADTVQAGIVPTFKEDFNNLPVKEGYYGPELEWPDLWEIGYYSPSYGATSDEFPEKLQISSINSYSYVNKWEYRTMNEIDVEQDAAYNGSVGIDMDCLDYGSSYSGNHTYGKVIATPVVELNVAEQPKFVFDMAYGRMVNGELTAVTGADVKVDHKVMLWVSADSGRTFNTTAPIQTWDGTALAAMSAGQTVTIDLSAYEGIRTFALGIQPTLNTNGGDEYLLWVDNIGIVNEKPMARSVKVIALSGQEATVRWVADPTVPEWIVKVTGGHLTAPKFYTATEPLQVVEGLDPEMTYTVAVSHIMANDTVTWNSVTFTTPGLTCDEPTQLAVSEVSRKSAMLTWQGDAADGYRVRYRPVAKGGAEPMAWVETEVEGTSCQLNNLALETEYECGVQSVCNKIGELESDYVAFDNFSTLALTCFTPTDVRIREIGPNKIDISWTGTSDNYQVAWMSQVTGSAWTYSGLISGETYTITGLDYYSFYTFKVRGVCSAGDSSEWSDTRNFRTLQRQACPDPANLRVEALTSTSATLLWDAEETEEGDIQSYILRHRAASVQAWDSIKDVKGNTYAITDMAPKTAYVWAVMTACVDDRYSENWAQLRFETLDGTAVEDLKELSGLYVAAAQGQIYVINPQAVQIDNIRIFSTMGHRLEQYAVRSRDNVILTTEVRNNIVVVEVESEGRFFRFKTMLP